MPVERGDCRDQGARLRLTRRGRCVGEICRHCGLTRSRGGRRRFARWGLTGPDDFLNLPGEIVSGHADRHVVRVVLGRDRSKVVAYLKREHRVRLRDRCAAWLASPSTHSAFSEQSARELSDPTGADREHPMTTRRSTIIGAW